ncbi:expressed protein [Phakopsora pachyrhizi]|uniref:Expressed protein n=1 Tax=Phakopsora pachyrhizi TaxID=170000 RepID=A0AAV0AFG1_PHAPC|nr:expressed protein [Phakopsora pachyrhizi]
MIDIDSFDYITDSLNVLGDDIVSSKLLEQSNSQESIDRNNIVCDQVQSSENQILNAFENQAGSETVEGFEKYLIHESHLNHLSQTSNIYENMNLLPQVDTQNNIELHNSPGHFLHLVGEVKNHHIENIKKHLGLDDQTHGNEISHETGGSSGGEIFGDFHESIPHFGGPNFNSPLSSIHWNKEESPSVGFFRTSSSSNVILAQDLEETAVEKKRSTYEETIRDKTDTFQTSNSQTRFPKKRKITHELLKKQDVSITSIDSMPLSNVMDKTTDASEKNIKLELEKALEELLKMNSAMKLTHLFPYLGKIKEEHLDVNHIRSIFSPDKKRIIVAKRSATF